MTSINAENRSTSNEDGANRPSRVTVRRVILCFGLLAVMSHPWWLWAFGEFLVAEQSIPPCDVAIVLSGDRKSTRLNSSHTDISRMPSSA